LPGALFFSPAALRLRALLAPPVSDGPASRAFCPRCRAQFVGEGGRCPHGVPLQPLK